MERSGVSRRHLRAVVAACALVGLAGCATLQQLTALRRVDFSLTGTAESSLAGVSIQSMRSYSDLSPLQLARVAAALAQGTLPFHTVLRVQASNPADNVQARLLKLDWTLFLDDQKTVSGEVAKEYVLPPGQPVTVEVPVQIDLLQFFHDQLHEMVDLALAATTGEGGAHTLRLDATPSIETSLGPIRYPEPISIQKTVGGSSGGG
jgi:hypothetical protein